MRIERIPVSGILTVANCFYFCLLLTVQSCNNQQRAERINPPEAASGEELLPQKVKEYISANFSGWSIPESSDYIKSWWSFYERGTIPYMVKTDINDDQTVDYGLVLKSVDKIRPVLLLSKGETFTHWTDTSLEKPFDAAEKDLHYGLSIEPAGRIDVAFPEIKSLILKSNAINFMDYEVRTCVFHWTGTTIEIFRTGNL